MGKLALKSYQWLLRAVVEALSLFPPRRMAKEEFALRLGRLPEGFKAPEGGSLWVHGASLGEVITLRPFLKELGRLYGRDRIICTTTTIDGLRQLQKDELCGFATLMPIELPACSVPFIEKINPKVLMINETEIWPLLLDTLKQRGIPYGIINGRINEKSVRMMRLGWALFESGVTGMSFAFPQEKQYLRRFRILGIDDEKQQALGCFKYDIASAPMPNIEEIRNKYGFPEDRPLICFGSTHPGEEAYIIEAVKPLLEKLNLAIIIAPRHVKRVDEVEKIITDNGLNYKKLSEKDCGKSRIVIVDSMGVLRDLYALSDLAYVGGSLIKRGGHNLMEPAAFSKPIIAGPYNFNFRYEVMALNRESAIKIVNGPNELQAVIESWKANPSEFKEMGIRARKVLDSMSGASKRTIEALQKLGFLPKCQM
jgi:3-deoxy-D-manno-octulosonic-acid transferase